MPLLLGLKHKCIFKVCLKIGFEPKVGFEIEAY